jgi:hypothetical protein
MSGVPMRGTRRYRSALPGVALESGMRSSRVAFARRQITNFERWCSHGHLHRDLADARAELDTNYFGTLEMIRAFAPVIESNGGGAGQLSVSTHTASMV